MQQRRELKGLAGIAFDLDGTLYQDGQPLPGAIDAVAAARDLGLAVRFLTNTTSRSRRAIAASLCAMAITARESEVSTPPVAAAAFLRHSNASAHLLVLPDAIEDFAGVRIDDDKPDYVVVGDLEEDWTFARLNHAFRLLHESGAKLLALGRTRYWQSASGLQLDAGAFVAALEYATGQTAAVFGKPDPEFFRAIVDDVGCDTRDIAVVGDDVMTDVGAAMTAGLRGVLVRTGKFRPTDLERGVKPDLIVANVGELFTDV